jgi:hypothetical protein
MFTALKNRSHSFCLCLLLVLSGAVLSQTPPKAPSLGRLFTDRWQAYFPAHPKDIDNQGRPILFHYIRFLSSNNLELHDVYQGGEDISHGTYRIDSASRIHIAIKSLNEDLAVTVKGPSLMTWKDPRGDEWYLTRCINSDCRDETSEPEEARTGPNAAIRKIDFRNFDYATDACPEVGTRGTIHVTNGWFTYHKRQSDEASFAIPSTETAIVYAPFFDPSSDEAVVTAKCYMEKSTSFSSEYFFFSASGNHAQLIGHLTEQMLAQEAKRVFPDYLIFEGRTVSVEYGRITISFTAGKARCCQDREITLSYVWQNGRLVNQGAGMGGLNSSSLKRTAGPSISGKVLRRYELSGDPLVEIVNASGKFLLRPYGIIASEPFTRPLKLAWNTIATKTPVGERIVGKDCTVEETSKATSKIALADDAREANCYSLESASHQSGGQIEVDAGGMKAEFRISPVGNANAGTSQSVSAPIGKAEYDEVSGTYAVTASAPGFSAPSQTVEVHDGEIVQVHFALRRDEAYFKAKTDALEGQLTDQTAIQVLNAANKLASDNPDDIRVLSLQTRAALLSRNYDQFQTDAQALFRSGGSFAVHLKHLHIGFGLAMHLSEISMTATTLSYNAMDSTCKQKNFTIPLADVESMQFGRTASNMPILSLHAKVPSQGGKTITLSFTTEDANNNQTNPANTPAGNFLEAIQQMIHLQKQKN